MSALPMMGPRQSRHARKRKDHRDSRKWQVLLFSVFSYKISRCDAKDHMVSDTRKQASICLFIRPSVYAYGQVTVCGDQVDITEHKCRSENNLQQLFSPSTMWLLEIKLRSTDLSASALTH